MKIIDDFMPSGWKLEQLQDDSYWGRSIDSFWKPCGSESNNMFEELCETVWTKYFESRKPIQISGWEYWTHSMYAGDYDKLDFHVDTDGVGYCDPDVELQYVDEGIYNVATHGFIFYCHREKPEGGYLEIKRDNGELERIEPVPNRLIIFDPSAQHRVTQVTKGVRRSFVSNLWKEKPNHL